MSCMQADFASLSTGELVKTLEAVAAELAVRPPPDSGTAALEWTQVLGRGIDLAEAGLAVLVRQVDACGAHQQLGFPSAVAWLRGRLCMRHGRAAERVTLARQLPRLERTAKLLSSGQLSVAYASAICDAVPRLDDADAALAEEILLDMVQAGCTVQQVGKAADRITDLIRERQGKAEEPQESRHGFARSWLQRAKSLDGGSWVKGWLTPEHTAAFDAIIGPLAKPKAPGDDRDLAQRTADATMSVLTDGNKGAGVTVIIDLAAYTTATTDTGPITDTIPFTGTGPPTHTDGSASADTGSPTGNKSPTSTSVPTNTNSPAPTGSSSDSRAFTGHARGRSEQPRRTAARLLDGSPISPQDARRIALNAGISALILGREGLPLYLGRTVRFVTPAQRKVLLAMYDSCVVHGCQIPAHLCEIHHLEGGCCDMRSLVMSGCVDWRSG